MGGSCGQVREALTELELPYRLIRCAGPPALVEQVERRGRGGLAGPPTRSPGIPVEELGSGSWLEFRRGPRGSPGR